MNIKYFDSFLKIWYTEMPDFFYVIKFEKRKINFILRRIGFVSLFNGISTFVVYSMPKPFS